MTTKVQQNNLSQNLKTKAGPAKSSIGAAFAILFIYGALLLMIGYTQGGLSKVLFPGAKYDNSRDGYMVYLLIAQSMGLIIATVILSKILKRFNIRYIFVVGFAISILSILMIAFIDKYPEAARVPLFIIFSLILGTAIGPMSPLVSTFFGSTLEGKQRARYVSLSNGFYGIGAGIIPLAGASAVIQLGGQSFSSTRYFYFIACALAVLGVVCGWFISYKHTKQQTSAKIIETKDKTKKISLLTPLIIVLVLMSLYMITETIVNYMFVNVTKNSNFTPGTTDTPNSVAIRATMAFGLLVIVQGLVRTLCGFFVVGRVKSWVYIIFSSLFLIIAMSLVISGGLQNSAETYIVAILFGIGLGNLWPAIFSYSISIDPRRSTYIGIWINFISMFWIPVTQIIVATIWKFYSKSDPNSIEFMSTFVIATISTVALLAITLYSRWYFKTKKINVE